MSEAPQHLPYPRETPKETARVYLKFWHSVNERGYPNDYGYRQADVDASIAYWTAELMEGS